jgi:hypothetical protein
VAELNDKSKHKPSPKHTLEEVRKSLEDLVRNQLDEVPAEDVAPPATPQMGDKSEGRSEVVHGRATLDTDELLESLKELITEQLEEPELTAAPTANSTDTGSVIHTEGSLPPAVAESTEAPVAADASHTPAAAAPPARTEAEGPPSPAPESDGVAEEITLEAVSAEADDDAGPPHGELELATPAPTTEASTGEALDVGPRSNETSIPGSRGAGSAVKVVEIPYAGGTLRAFAIRDPVLGSIVESGESTDTAQPPAALAGTSVLPVFADAWAVELTREPCYSELGFLEGAVRGADDTEARSGAIEEITLELPEESPAAETVVLPAGEPVEHTEQLKDADADHPGVSGVSAREVKGSAGQGRDIVEAPEIPGAEQLTEPSDENFEVAHLAVADKDTETQLRLDIADEPQPPIEEPQAKVARSDAPPASSKVAPADEKGVLQKHKAPVTEAQTAPEPAEPQVQASPVKTTETPRIAVTEGGAAPEKTPSAKKKAASQRSFIATAERGQDLRMPTIEFTLQDGADQHAKSKGGLKEHTGREEIGRQTEGKVAHPSSALTAGPLDQGLPPADSEFIDLGRPESLFVKPPAPSPAPMLGKTNRAESPPERVSPRRQKAVAPLTRKPERPPKSQSTMMQPPKKLELRKLPNKLGKPPAQTEKTTATWSAVSIPVLETVVSKTESAKSVGGAFGFTHTRATDKKPVAERTPRHHSESTAVSSETHARALAVQIVAKLNSELRKCGERALTPATIERLQYLLREALEGKVPDNLRDKR